MSTTTCKKRKPYKRGARNKTTKTSTLLKDYFNKNNIIFYQRTAEQNIEVFLVPYDIQKQDITKAPIVSYLESEYGYNPEHTYWASNPLELLDYIRDTCQVPENKIVFVDYQANKSLPYQTALSKTQYTRIGPLDFIVESESRHYRETKKYISCYAKEFANCYMNAYYI